MSLWGSDNGVFALVEYEYSMFELRPTTKEDSGDPRN